MTSYEIVRRAIEFGKPDRLPLRFEALGVCDTHFVGWNQVRPYEVEATVMEFDDEWGCRWVRTGIANMGQPKGHPLGDWRALDRFRWPDPDDPALYEGMAGRLAGAGDKYVLTGIFMLLFERMHSLRGFENALVDLYLERANIEALADRIVQFDLGVIANVARLFPRAVHGLSFTDDWGTERGLFIQPRLWEEFFKPRYRRIFAAAHAAGWHVWMHTCGKVNDILESLIEIGLDVVNLQQPRVLGIEEIGRRFRGRICFESLCDIQRTLPFGTPAEIEAEARLLLAHWGTGKGGFILSDYGDGAAIGVEVERKRAMLEAFLRAEREIPALPLSCAEEKGRGRRRPAKGS